MLSPLTSFMLYHWRERERQRERERERQREREREREREKLLSTSFVAFDETEPEYDEQVVLGDGTQML